MKNGAAHELIRAPWFSEKALIATERGVYAFAVSQGATKHSVAKAIKEIYNVTPTKVRIVNMPGKKVSSRTRAAAAYRASRRKAYVYLKKGETIQFA